MFSIILWRFKGMTQKEFIKLEAKVLMDIVKDQNLLFELIEDGLADDLRIFAEVNHYDVDEVDLKRIVMWKMYKKLFYM